MAHLRLPGIAEGAAERVFWGEGRVKNVRGMGFKEWVDRVAVSASFIAFQRCHLSFLIRCSCFVFVSASLGCVCWVT